MHEAQFVCTMCNNQLANIFIASRSTCIHIFYMYYESIKFQDSIAFMSPDVFVKPLCKILRNRDSHPRTVCGIAGKSISEAHDGEVTIENEEGQG
jgi:hypothetical protein